MPCHSKQPLIAPSVLACDLSNLAEASKMVLEAGQMCCTSMFLALGGGSASTIITPGTWRRTGICTEHKF